MSNAIELHAESRTDTGKGASRRLRRLEEKVPVILYGESIEPRMLTLLHKDLWKAQESEAFFSSVLSIKIDGKEEEQAIIKDLQRHPSREFILHADFQHVQADTEITVNVPLHFLNEEQCPGVKLEGGIVSHMATDIALRCLPRNLPEYIEVDVAELSVGDIIHLSELKLPQGVESVDLLQGDEGDISIVQITPRQAMPEEEEEGGAEEQAGGDESAESGQDDEGES